MLKKIASVLILVIVGLCLLYGCFAFVQKKQLQKAEGLYQIPRTELLNKIIAEKNLHSYVEIGLSNPYANYTNIIAEQKYSVDIDELLDIKIAKLMIKEIELTK